MKITKFEDLKCWQEARKLVNMVYEAIRNSSQFQKDFKLVGQITDASVSSMSNIAEGFSRRSNKEFIQFLFVSKSSAAEVQSEAYVAQDQRYISKETFAEIYEQADQVSKIVSGLITYLLKNEKKLVKLNKLNKLNKRNKRNNPPGQSEHEETYL
jgi:four helix bundle protein